MENSAFLRPISMLFIIGIFIFLIFTIMKEKNLNLLNLYLLIISVVSIVGIAIGYGVLVYTLIQQNMISDQEYLAKNDYGTYDSCENDVKYGTSDTQNKTQEEIDQCKQRRDSGEITRRHVNNKESMISGGVWGTIFLILFLSHFPIFLKRNKEIKEIIEK